MVFAVISGEPSVTEFTMFSLVAEEAEDLEASLRGAVSCDLSAARSLLRR